MMKVIGEVKRFKFQNHENAYKVIDIVLEDTQTLTVTGIFPVINEGLAYEFTGEYIDTKFGRQFKADSYNPFLGQSPKGLITYIAVTFTGIGEKTATKIVNKLGINCLDLILEDPQLLPQFKLNEFKAQRFIEELTQHHINSKTMSSLLEYGISASAAAKLFSKYKGRSHEVITTNPFTLIDDVEGFGFKRTLEVARKVGFDNTHIYCVKATIIYCLKQLAQRNGDLYTKFSFIEETVNKLLETKINIEPAIFDLIDEGKITKVQDEYYLKWHYESEISLAGYLKNLNNSIDLNEDLESLITSIEKEKNISYATTQQQAIKTSLTNQLSVITGGPGTGKTTIIAGLISAYMKINQLRIKNGSVVKIKEADQSDAASRIGLMAPTGRAAKRMKEVLGITAKTIHSTLGWDLGNGFAYNRYQPLDLDFIIIDEASMIDIGLAKALFEAIPHHCQVVIVGDADQLPSVGPGRFLGDVIDAGTIKVTRLTTIHRQGKDSNIIVLANKINQQVLTYNDLYTNQEVTYISGLTPALPNFIVKTMQNAIDRGFDIINDIQILIPMYKYEVGIEAINILIQKNFNENCGSEICMRKTKYNFYEGDKVIQLVNDGERKVMNGDIGVIDRIAVDGDDKMFLVVNFDDNQVMYYQKDLDELDLAYAVSIHKSQGSEYKVAIFPIVKQHYIMLKKELIYTAVTRAKEKLIIMGDFTELIRGCNQVMPPRKTKLAQRLNMVEFDALTSPHDFMLN